MLTIGPELQEVGGLARLGALPALQPSQPERDQVSPQGQIQEQWWHLPKGVGSTALLLEGSKRRHGSSGV